jgi:hypothetical protein
MIRTAIKAGAWSLEYAADGYVDISEAPTPIFLVKPWRKLPEAACHIYAVTESLVDTFYYGRDRAAEANADRVRFLRDNIQYDWFCLALLSNPAHWLIRYDDPAYERERQMIAADVLGRMIECVPLFWSLRHRLVNGLDMGDDWTTWGLRIPSLLQELSSDSETQRRLWQASTRGSFFEMTELVQDQLAAFTQTGAVKGIATE